MKSFTKIAAQGEITIIRLGNVPKNKKLSGVAMKPEGQHFIVGHSETGHHHVIEAKGASIAVMEKAPQGMRILRAILENPTTLDHMRDYDTHESIQLEPAYTSSASAANTIRTRKSRVGRPTKSRPKTTETVRRGFCT